MQSCLFGATGPCRNANQDVFTRGFRVLNKDVEVAAIVEDAGIHQLKLGIEPRAPTALINQLLIREFLLRILVQRLHVGMRRRVVEVEVAFLYIFSVIAFRSAQSEEPLLQKRIAAIPHRHSKADELMPITKPGNTILVPAIRTRSRLIVREVTPGVSVRTVVLTDRTPRALAEIGPPALPIDLTTFIYY